MNQTLLQFTKNFKSLDTKQLEKINGGNGYIASGGYRKGQKRG